MEIDLIYGYTCRLWMDDYKEIWPLFTETYVKRLGQSSSVPCKALFQDSNGTEQ